MGAHQLYFPERQIYDQGHNAGISEGIAIGRAQTEAKLATAQQALYNTYVSLRKDGIPKSKALRYTGLSKELALKAEDELAQ